MGSWRGSEQTIGQNFKMKLLLALCMLGLATASQDYKMFMKWAKTKAMESCWGEDNMKAYTVNMKKAVAKCQQRDQMESFAQFYKFTKMMEMMNSHSDDSYMSYNIKERKPIQTTYSNDYSSDSSNMNMMEKIKMMMMMKKMMDSKNDGHHDMSYSHNQNNHGYKSSDYNNYMKTQSRENTDMSQLWDTMSKLRFKRQTDDSLALNDRLTDKLKTMMEEHVHKVSNMTCVLRELNVIDYNNNIDVNAIKEDSKQYNGPLKNLGKIKSFMNCCKSAKMKLCMYQDT